MKIKVALYIVLICVFIFGSGITSQAMAIMDGDGKSTALDLAESDPANGDMNVALDAQIKLLFNKNVVNMTIKDNNSKCFTLLDADKNEVPMDVIFADDQIEPDKKREIILKPKEVLQENMTYSVEILSGLQAKNGTSLSKTVTFSFTTIALTPEAEEPQATVKNSAVTESSQPQEEKPIIEVETPTPIPEEAEVSPSDIVKAAEEVKSADEANTDSSENEAVNSNNLGNHGNNAYRDSVSMVLPITLTAIAALIIAALVKAKKRKS